jgi:hypothetical protein
MAINEQFWIKYQVSDKDLDSIYNHLLEVERPLTAQELSTFLINQIIIDQSALQYHEKVGNSRIYLPKDEFHEGDVLVFPAINWSKGKVKTIRKGNNPDFPTLKVIEVEFENKESKLFASELDSHKLNNPVIMERDEFLELEYVTSNFGKQFAENLDAILIKNPDLVCIAGSFFPKALLVDISVGHLNLCEAVLEMAKGGPLSTHELLSQIEFPTDDNLNLTEFSLNYALEEDERFDEVGPAGVTLWFLKRLEPIEVQTTPLYLQFSGSTHIDPEYQNYHTLFIHEVTDELDPEPMSAESASVTISINYPHWRSGTLPLTPTIKNFFPTAYETPRVKFSFVDASNGQTFPGWVVRPSRYIFGLREWYLSHGIFPGSYITIQHGANPGEVIVNIAKNRNAKDWIRTVLAGADGGLVFALLKQVISCTYDEHMALMITDVKAIDAIWERSIKSKQTDEKIIFNTMTELSKLNPQGQIHAQELYSAVNIFRRLPPAVIIQTLFSQPWSKHLGDLYFRIENG